MIRNIEDDKKKLKRRQDSGFSGYLSDEELYELIGYVEEKEMLHAPAHLKDNVMTQIRRKRKIAGKKRMFAYRAKVLVAMAAALAVLILMPDGAARSTGQMFAKQQMSRSIEWMVLERQGDIDADRKQYFEEHEDGMRGFFRGINEKITEFGTSLYGIVDTDRS